MRQIVRPDHEIPYTYLLYLLKLVKLIRVSRYFSPSKKLQVRFFCMPLPYGIPRDHVGASAPHPPPPPSTPPTPLAELRPQEPPREPLVLLPASQPHGESWALPSARSTHAAQLATPKPRRRLRGGSANAHQAVVWACLLVMALRAWQRRTARQIQARVARGGRPAHSPHWAFVLCRPLSYPTAAAAPAHQRPRTEQPLRLTPTTRRLSPPHARGGKAWTAQGASALVPRSVLTRRAARAHLRARVRWWQRAAAAVAEALAAPVRAAAPRLRHRARARLGAVARECGAPGARRCTGMGGGACACRAHAACLGRRRGEAAPCVEPPCGTDAAIGARAVAARRGARGAAPRAHSASPGAASDAAVMRLPPPWALR